jgi:hypothetical protein
MQPSRAARWALLKVHDRRAAFRRRSCRPPRLRRPSRRSMLGCRPSSAPPSAMSGPPRSRPASPASPASRRRVLGPQSRICRAVRAPPASRHPAVQVPMSRFELDEHINDRYQAIEERLSVGGPTQLQHAPGPPAGRTRTSRRACWAAGRQEAPEQPADPGGEGGASCLRASCAMRLRDRAGADAGISIEACSRRSAPLTGPGAAQMAPRGPGAANALRHRPARCRGGAARAPACCAAVQTLQGDC